MRRLVLVTLAGICLVLAVFSLPLPLPAGLLFSTIAFALLLMASPALQRWFQHRRARHPALDERLRTVEAWLPAVVRRALNGGGASHLD